MPPRLDTVVTAETPEGILLELRPAGVTARLFAFLIDFAVRAGVLYVVAIGSSMFGGLGVGFWLICFFVLEWFYPVVFELSRMGATPGKRSLGLRVVMDDGLPVTPAASLTRNLLRTADFLPFLYGFALASMLLRSDFKRLGDLAAKTLVVHAPAMPRHGGIAEDVAPIAPPRALDARERAAVIAFAERAPSLTSARAAEIAQLARLEPGSEAEVRSEDPVARLVGIARWLLGARSAAR